MCCLIGSFTGTSRMENHTLETVQHACSTVVYTKGNDYLGLFLHPTSSWVGFGMLFFPIPLC